MSPPEKPFRVICISVYPEDLEVLDRKIGELKKRGFTRANRSSVIRLAIEQCDTTKARKGL